MLYTSREGKKILMVQTFADRWKEPTYHIKRTRRPLRRCLKVYGSRRHPVPESTATRCIQNAISNIIDLDPDIVGLGGKGRTARKIRSGLKKAGCRAAIAYWGADVPSDAEQFLQGHGVDPPY